jgi:hypothetical protein
METVTLPTARRAVNMQIAPPRSDDCGRYAFAPTAFRRFRFMRAIVFP